MQVGNVFLFQLAGLRVPDLQFALGVDEGEQFPVGRELRDVLDVMEGSHFRARIVDWLDWERTTRVCFGMEYWN